MTRWPIGITAPYRKPKQDWRKLIRGVRVEKDKVIIMAKGGNEAARELCGALLKEKER
jgi:vacuolar-type H+-ATPase catalytic subunit A/Vma1